MMRVLMVSTVLMVATAGLARMPTLQTGDVIFQTNSEGQGLAVMRATRSEYSHVGVVTERDGKPWVFEASDKVKYTPLDKWIERGDRNHYVVKRLKNAENVWTPERLEAFKKAEGKYDGLPYDTKFGWSDDRIYCSELVWKLYDEALGIKLSAPQKVSEFNLQDPVVQADIKQRYGGEVPLDEIAVSPQAILESPLLEAVE